MGLFKTLKNIDQAIDHAAGKVAEFANTRDYTMNITLDGEVIGRLEFTTSNPDYAKQKLSNYLSTGLVNLDKPMSDAIAFYNALDSINIGASKQIFLLDMDKLKAIYENYQKAKWEKNKNT